MMKTAKPTAVILKTPAKGLEPLSPLTHLLGRICWFFYIHMICIYIHIIPKRNYMNTNQKSLHEQLLLEWCFLGLTFKEALL